MNDTTDKNTTATGTADMKETSNNEVPVTEHSSADNDGRNQHQQVDTRNHRQGYGDTERYRSREASLFDSLFGVLFRPHPLLNLFDTFPAVTPRLQAARWGLESTEQLEDGSHLVRFNLAGWKKEEVKVSLDTRASKLTVTAERNNSENGRAERRDFYTSITIPTGTTKEDVKVVHEDGVLSVHLAAPTGETDSTITIPVE